MASRDLRNKLRRSFGVDRAEPGADAPAAADPDAASSPLRVWIERRRRELARDPPRVVDLDVALGGGEECENAGGKFWLRRERIPLTALHGRHPLARVRGTDFDSLRGRTKTTDLDGAALETCAFLDTETTGLGGGAGTTVFLTGLGFVEGEELVLEQVFLRGFSEERAALLHVVQRLSERPLQVTFVGKSFDRHRLAARMTLHHIPHAMLDPRHLDLYHVARRAWKDELPDVRLRTVEEHRLGLVRTDDLPGSEAPQAWLDWLRDGTGRVDRVMEHNRLDVLSLVALLAELGAP